MIIRPMVESDLDSVLSCPVDAPFRWATPKSMAANLESGTYRHDRVWLAVDDDGIAARAVWWGFAGGPPLALDCLYVRDDFATGPQGLAARLLSTAHNRFLADGLTELPEHHMFLPVGWREDTTVAAEVAWRKDVLASVGMTEELERHQFVWTPDRGIPDPPSRLVFRPEPDDERFAEVFRQVAVDTLDVTTRKELTRMDAMTQAREDLAMYRQMPGDRDWWRLAYTPDGELVGLAIPSANNGGPVVGYLGVVPRFRGRGHVDELLAEITRVLAANGAEKIRADTDFGNLPMANAFERVGYRRTGVRMVVGAPVG